MASSPSIVYPITNWSATNNKYYSDKLTQVIEGIIPAVLSEIISGEVILLIEYRYQITRGTTTSAWTSYFSDGAHVGITDEDLEEVSWYLNTDGIIDMLEDDIVTFNFKTIEKRRINGSISYTISESDPITLIVEIVNEDDIIETAVSPSGVSLKRAKDYIKLLVPNTSIAVNEDSEFVGINFYISLTAGGGKDGYQIMNDTYVSTVDSSETEEISSTINETISETSEITTTITRTQMVESTYYTYTFTKDILSILIADNKIPNIFLSDGISLSPDNIYYFVSTIVAYDKNLNQVVESHFSVELEAKFLDFNKGINSIPSRNRNDVLRNITTRLVNDNKSINVISGSVIRDIIDPVTLEFEKFYVIQDFVFKCQSIDALALFDDADGDGTSDPFATSISKRKLADALGITNSITLQTLIDSQFDKWAANYNLSRKGAVSSRGTVIFYTKIQPTNDILIPDGTEISTSPSASLGVTTVTFRVVGNHYMQAANAQYYYNTILKRYEIIADIESKVEGSIGNVPPNSITAVSGISPIISVENTSPTDFGEDSESNADLFERIKLASISFDSGTEGGYLSTVLKVPGVTQARVEKEGDPLMIRDYDQDSGNHIGGKVDVYIRGERVLQTIDKVTFKYEYPANVNGDNSSEVFSIINASEFRLKCKNPRIGVNSPIVSVTSVKNATRMANYEVAGILIVGDGDIIILPDTLTNRNIGMASFDVIEVNYKYRSSNIISLANQPVRNISEVRDSSNTLIDDTMYRIVKNEDPLTTGTSNISKYGIEFLFESGEDFTEFITITNEEHDLYFNTPAALGYLGADASTIIVKSADDLTVEYVENVDYSITTGTLNTETYINLITGSKIRQGDRIAVSYTASQNFLVTYTYNSLIAEVKDKIEEMKHACADVIVKEAIKNNIDVSCMIIRQSGIDRSRLKARIQTSIANYVNNMKTGETFTQSTLINLIRSVDGVKDVQMPLTKMMKRNKSFIPLDDLGYLNFEIYQRTSSFGIISYKSINSVLSYNTMTNGGPDNLFRAIYEDNIALELVDDPADVSRERGRAYIYSNGKIIVSTIDGMPPQTKYYKAAYYVSYENNEYIVEDISVGEIEYIEIDSASLRDIEVIDEKTVKRGL